MLHTVPYSTVPYVVNFLLLSILVKDVTLINAGRPSFFLAACVRYIQYIHIPVPVPVHRLLVLQVPVRYTVRYRYCIIGVRKIFLKIFLKRANCFVRTETKDIYNNR